MFLRLRHFLLALIAVAIFAGQVVADERKFRLYAPPALIESGVLKYMLPRFSLKTQVRIDLVDDPAQADASFGTEGIAVFQGLGQRWHFAVPDGGHPGALRFGEWIGSEVGRRTVVGFEVDGTALFSLPSQDQAAAEAATYDGDAVAGRIKARGLCGRCHVVVAADRMNAIGSTPSFFALRSLGNWEDRFAAFFALNPHPAFTQVEDVTDPFPVDRPSPIVPVALTLDDLEAIIAYVAALEPADLGAPLDHQ